MYPDYFVSDLPGRSQTARFQVVAGRSYEGAIIPATHNLDWFREPSVTAFWTPAPEDVEVAEELLLAYLTRAAADPWKVVPPPSSVGTMSPPSSVEELRELVGSLARYKRQYVGRMCGSHRRILVNGLFETIARDWGERLFNVIDGGCGYWHFDADLPQGSAVDAYERRLLGARYHWLLSNTAERRLGAGGPRRTRISP